MNKQTIWTFLRYIFPYALILFAVSIIGNRIYDQATQTLTDQTVQVQMSMLESSKQVVDSVLNEVDDMAVDFSLKTQYRTALFKAQNDIKDFYDHIEVWNTFNTEKLNAGYVEDYLIYFDNTDFLITSKNISLDPSKYYNDFIRYGDMSFSQWKEFLSHSSRRGFYQPATSVNLNGYSGNVISYVRALPFDVKQPKAALQVFIKESAIQDAFNGYVLDNQGTILILNEEGDIITHRGNLDEWNEHNDDISFDNLEDYLYLKPSQGEKWGEFLVYVKSDQTDWTYISILPEEVVLSKVNKAMKDIAWAFMSILVVILVLGLLSVLYNVKSIRGILRKVQVFGGKGNILKDDYSVINTNLDSLIESHDRMAFTFQKQAPRIINNMLLDLVLGKYASLDDIIETLEEMGVKIRRDHYCVALFKIAKLDNASLQKIVVKETMEALGNNDILATNYAIDRVAVLFLGDGDEEKFRQSIEMRINHGVDAIRAKEIECFCVVGTVTHKLQEIHKSTASAAKVVANILFNGTDTVYYYDNMYRDYVSVSYSSEMEQKIINLVKQGDSEEVIKLLDQMIEQRRADEKNALKMKEFYMQLFGTLSKITDDPQHNSDFFHQLEYSFDENEMAGEIKKEYISAAEMYSNRKKNKSGDVVLLIKDYIKENYMNSSLGLAEIAEKYNMSEVYFSQIFKSVTDENFSSYLESIRMEKARELLQDTDMTVEAVALAVGYNSINTFHKAFKRVNGVTPGAFKKIQKMQ